MHSNIYMSLVIPLCRIIFTADPGGRLRLWKLHPNLISASLTGRGSCDVFLVAEYASCFGMRIMCVDASFNEEVNIFIIVFSLCFFAWFVTPLLRVVRNKTRRHLLNAGKYDNVMNFCPL